MKIIFALLAVLPVVPVTVLAQSYTVFRVCEDVHVLRTSDGADAGRVEYIVVEPARHRIVSTVVTGGVVGEKFVSVPFSSFSFGGEKEVTLKNVTRERLTAAPVIEKSRLTSTSLSPEFVQPAFTHFGVSPDADVDAERTATTDNDPAPDLPTATSDSALPRERDSAKMRRGKAGSGTTESSAEVSTKAPAEDSKSGTAETETAAGRTAEPRKEKAAGSKAAPAQTRKSATGAAKKTTRAVDGAADRATRATGDAVDSAGRSAKEGVRKTGRAAEKTGRSGGETAGKARDAAEGVPEKSGRNPAQGTERPDRSSGAAPSDRHVPSRAPQPDTAPETAPKRAAPVEP